MAETIERPVRSERVVVLAAAFGAIAAALGMLIADLVRVVSPRVDDVACNTGPSYFVNVSDLVKFAAVGMTVLVLTRLAAGHLSTLGRRVALVAAVASIATGLANGVEHCAHVEVLGIAYALGLMVGLASTIWFGFLLARTGVLDRWVGWVISLGAVAFMLGAEQDWGRPAYAAAWTAVGVGLLMARADATLRPGAVHINGGVILLGGLLGGSAWGMTARLWMRFISTDPEFSWSGTLFIVVGFAVAGLGQAGAYLARRADLPRRRLTVVRVLGFVSLLPLGMAAGGPMFPVVILGALLVTHPEWPAPTKGALGLAMLLPIVGVGLIITDDLPLWKGVVAVTWCAVIYAAIVWAARFTLGPQRDGWRAPLVLRIAGFVGVAAVAMLGAVLIGNPT